MLDATPVAKIVTTIIATVVAEPIVAPVESRTHVGARLQPLADDAAGARIGVEPDDAAFGRHPFQAIAHLAVGAAIGTFGVVELAGMAFANSGKDAVQLRVLLGAGRNRRKQG
ncbi:MAG: hypothetical protein JOZ72_06995 [Alphaproteobacteria bacterium]|nr:hypothetical protein [Alphaproteobacteria bacterium]